MRQREKAEPLDRSRIDFSERVDTWGTPSTPQDLDWRVRWIDASGAEFSVSFPTEVEAWVRFSRVRSAMASTGDAEVAIVNPLGVFVLVVVQGIAQASRFLCHGGES